MNSDQFNGLWNEFRGEVQRQWGRFTDDDLLEIKGDYTKFLGIAQKRYGDQIEAVKEWADQWLDEHPALQESKRR